MDIPETGEPILRLDLQDTEWPLTYTDHDRKIARAIVVDTEGYFYFVRAVRDDEFGKATLIETAGGGVEIGKLIANRELPVLRRAKQILDRHMER